jgi:hypothetical protein
MLSSPVYTEFHPRRAVSHARAFSNSFLFSPAFNNSMDQHPNDLQTLSKASHTMASLYRLHRSSKSFGGNTYGHPRKCCKQKTYGKPNSFRCNTYKNRAWGVSILFRSRHQIPVTALVSTIYKLPIFYPLCFDIHPCNGGLVPPPEFPFVHPTIYGTPQNWQTEPSS